MYKSVPLQCGHALDNDGPPVSYHSFFTVLRTRTSVPSPTNGQFSRRSRLQGADPGKPSWRPRSAWMLISFGRDGFSSGFSAAHQQSRINCISELEDVVVVGEVAYTLSRDSLSVTPRAAGEAMQFAGHRMTVFRKQPDGRWLLARDANTLSPVAKQGS